MTAPVAALRPASTTPRETVTRSFHRTRYDHVPKQRKMLRCNDGHYVKARLWGVLPSLLGQHQVQWLAAHEPFDLALGPGECLFYRFALQITYRHLCHDTLCIYLPGNPGR